MARGCARVDSRLDTAKICSDRRVDADRPRLRAVFGGGKTFSHSLGQNRKSRRLPVRSVLPPTTDICRSSEHVRLAPRNRHSLTEPARGFEWRHSRLTCLGLRSMTSCPHSSPSRQSSGTGSEPASLHWLASRATFRPHRDNAKAWSDRVILDCKCGVSHQTSPFLVIIAPVAAATRPAQRTLFHHRRRAKLGMPKTRASLALAFSHTAS